MATAVPAIACLGVIGRNNTPLHTTIFPTTINPTTGAPASIRTALQFSLLLSSALDVFTARARQAASASQAVLVSGELGLLYAVDDRLAVYGFETNTTVRFLAIVDMRGRLMDPSGYTGGAPTSVAGGRVAGVGLREAELKVVFRAMQTAYVRLLQNPFYDPDEGERGRRINSQKFTSEMRRIGEVWIPGSANAV